MRAMRLVAGVCTVAVAASTSVAGGSPIGACCVFELCSNVTEAECVAIDGTWQGPDTACGPFVCFITVGVCCLPDGTCAGPFFSGDCEVRNGVYQGDNSRCTDVECVPFCIADVNGDGAVDAADLSVLIAEFGLVVPPGTGADLNGDGAVDAADLSLMIGDFGCTPGA